MSFDLVKRLRAAGTFDAVCHTEEAADRITALEAERDALAECYDALTDITQTGGFRHITDAQEQRLKKARATLAAIKENRDV